MASMSKMETRAPTVAEMYDSYRRGNLWRRVNGRIGRVPCGSVDDCGRQPRKRDRWCGIYAKRLWRGVWRLKNAFSRRRSEGFGGVIGGLTSLVNVMEENVESAAE